MFIMVLVLAWDLNSKYTLFFPNVKTKNGDLDEVVVRFKNVSAFVSMVLWHGLHYFALMLTTPATSLAVASDQSLSCLPSSGPYLMSLSVVSAISFAISGRSGR